MTEKDEYIGSERHYQDLIKAAGKEGDPETLSEAMADFRAAWRQLFEALGVFRLGNWFLIRIGRVLIRMRSKNGK